MILKSRFPKITYSIVLLIISLLGFSIGIHFITPNEALTNDAQSYLALAEYLAKSNNLLQDLLFPQEAFFIDSGYALLLSLVIRFFPQNFLVVSQLVNYLLWGFPLV